MITQQERIIKKFKLLSLNYHNMSLLFNELGNSINIELRKKGINPNSLKQIKEYLKTLNLDFDKIMSLSKIDIKFKDLKKEGLKE